MKYLQKLTKASKNSTFVERNGYRGVVFYDNSDANYTDDYPEMDYTNTEMKNTPFTIKIMGKSGVLRFMFIPGLYIEQIRFDKNWTIYGYLDYINDDVNIFTIPVQKDDIVHMWVVWDSETQRTLGQPLNEVLNIPSSTFEYDASFIGSNISCTCEYRVYGNLLSLLSNDFTFDDSLIPKAGKYTFAGLFEEYSYDDDYFEITAASASSEPNYIESYSVENNTLIYADLYLPKILKQGVYKHMFAFCYGLKRGPKFINIPSSVNGYANYCAGIFFGCQNLDYHPVVKCLNKNETYNNSQIVEMFAQCYSLRECSFFMDHFNWYSSPFLNTNLDTLYINKRCVCSSGWKNRLSLSDDTDIIECEMEPIIWIEHFLSRCFDESGDLTAHVQFYEDYCIPYKFVGTCWMEDDCRSYYVWQLYYDIAQNTGFEDMEEYIFTTEKDFTGLSLTDDINNRFFPVKYQLSDDLSNIYSQINKEFPTPNILGTMNSPILVHWSGVVPDAEAGVPRIWVDDSVHNYDSELNYYKAYYANGSNEYRLIGTINRGYLWEFCGTEDNKFLSESYIDSISSRAVKYLYSTSIRLDYYKKASHEGYGNRYGYLNNARINEDRFWMGGLSRDEVEAYVTSEKHQIVMTNMIYPDMCDWQL